MFATSDEGFDWIGSLTNLERLSGHGHAAYAHRQRYKLDGMRRLLQDFREPQQAFRSVHIAGSKGKGSTAAFVAAIATAAGLRVGCYTSPHVEHYAERIRLFPDMPQEELLLAEMQRIYRYVEGRASTERPTTFELLTLLAYLVFRAAGCQLAVIEVGLGGRLDCTNILAPLASVICPIEIEHSEYLGDTLVAIATEKAGIIKSATPLFVARQPDDALRPISARAQQVGAPLYQLSELSGRSRVRVRASGTYARLHLRRLDRKGSNRMRPWIRLRARLGLAGHLQVANAELALLVALYLWPDISMVRLRAGLARAFLPGRFELLCRRPPLIIDCAHTPAAAAAVATTFNHLYGRKGVLLFGCFRGKRYQEMASRLAPGFRSIVITRPSELRPSDPEALQLAFRRYNPATCLVVDTVAALQRALELSAGRRPILVAGSCYLAGVVRSAIRGFAVN